MAPAIVEHARQSGGLGVPLLAHGFAHRARPHHHRPRATAAGLAGARLRAAVARPSRPAHATSRSHRRAGTVGAAADPHPSTVQPRCVLLLRARPGVRRRLRPDDDRHQRHPGLVRGRRRPDVDRIANPVRSAVLDGRARGGELRASECLLRRHSLPARCVGRGRSHRVLSAAVGSAARHRSGASAVARRPQSRRPHAFHRRRAQRRADGRTARGRLDVGSRATRSAGDRGPRPRRDRQADRAAGAALRRPCSGPGAGRAGPVGFGRGC